MNNHAKARKISEKLDILLNNVVTDVFESKSLFSTNDNELRIGKVTIVRNNGFFSVVDNETNVSVYSGIYLIEAALLLGKYYQTTNKAKIKNIVELESKYVKYRLDMQSYHHTYKRANEANDIPRLITAEVRYNEAKLHSDEYKTQIRNMCSQLAKRR